ncbi:MAG: lipopolysaccharide assembly protein LapA domain-containing protein [Pseudomonadales bacterium]
MRALAKLFWAVLAILLFCFALLAVNQGQVALRFLSWQTPEVSVFWWLLLAFFLGVAVSAIGFGLVTLRLRLRQRSLGKQLEASDRELKELRNLTLQD